MPASRCRTRCGCAVLAGLTLLASCGTRVSAEQTRAGGSISLPADVLDQVRRAAATGAAGASASAGLRRDSPDAPERGSAGSRPVAEADAAVGIIAEVAGSAPAAVAGSLERRPAAVPRSGPLRPVGAPQVPAPSAPAAGCVAPGAPVTLGQVGSFSGIAGPITAGARTALAVWARDVNLRGGIACHPVVLHSVDDAADAARSAAVVEELANNRKAVALVGSFTVLSMAGFRSAVEDEKIPAVGGDVLSTDWNDSPYFFPQGAGFDAQVFGLVKQAVDAGQRQIGLLYCVEAASCTSGAKKIEAQTAKAGGTLAYSSAISLTQTDFTAQCQNAKSAGVEVLGLAMDGSAMGRVARSCAALSYRPKFAASGLIISPAQATDPDLRRNGVATASVNAPWMREDTPGQRAYHRALEAYAPGAVPDAASIAAWSAGKLFEAAIAALGTEARDGAITRELVLKGLGLVRKETLGGLAPPITFSPGQARAPEIRCVYYELLTTDGWIAPRASRPVCA